MEYTNLMSVLDDCFDQSNPMLIHWDGGCIIKGVNGTGAFESDNGLELDDENYQEYYACGIEIVEIIKATDSPKCREIQETLTNGYMVEITPFNEPLKIESIDGQLLWSREEK
ncbi:hypothetical protein LJB86_02585 [Deltaproteobacteria bacterium OttesenSCG-928-M10]|nr:hypothetical protein [Deltaproteobacteria bacterium OttesenSCG-928-M10]